MPTRTPLPLPRLLAVALLAAAVAVAAARPAAAQGRGRDAATATVLGVVRDTTGRPLADVHVSAVGTRYGVYTRSDGSFTLPPVPAGAQLVRARRIGYGPEIATMVLAPGDTAELQFTLARVQVLAAVVTEGRSLRERRYAAFEERRLRGFGSFITREQMEKWHATRPSDALRRVAGVRFDYDQYGRKHMVMSRTAALNGPCRPLVYVDGSIWIMPADMDVDFALPGMMEIEAIEVYKGPASVPVTLNATGSACGVVSIWTR